MLRIITKGHIHTRFMHKEITKKGDEPLINPIASRMRLQTDHPRSFYSAERCGLNTYNTHEDTPCENRSGKKYTYRHPFVHGTCALWSSAEKKKQKKETRKRSVMGEVHTPLLPIHLIGMERSDGITLRTTNACSVGYDFLYTRGFTRIPYPTSP